MSNPVHTLDPSALDTSVRRAVPVAKIAIPRLSVTFRRRQRLIDALADTPMTDVVLLSGPAGSGKTLLLADWLGPTPSGVAWVTIDEADNDDRRVWTAVVEALCAMPMVAAGNSLHQLTVPDNPSLDPYFVTELVQLVEALHAPVRVVLDDFHRLSSRQVFNGVSALLRDRPPNLQLVVSTRADPPIGTPRLRLSGQLREIRAADLAFTVDETREMVGASGFALTDAQTEKLVLQTGGWAAGLRLTVMSWTARDGKPAPMNDEAPMNDSAIAGYLVSEVLDSISPEVLDVLTAISVVEDCSAEEAVVLSGRRDAAMLLDTLERESALVTSYGQARQWFRLNPMLRSYLGADLQRRDPSRLARLHRRAAGWFTNAGRTGAALEHARLSKDPDLVVEVLEYSVSELVHSGDHAEIRRAVESLDKDLLRSTPRLLLAYALAQLEIGDLVVADFYARQATDLMSVDPVGQDVADLVHDFTSRRAWTVHNVRGEVPEVAPVDDQPQAAGRRALLDHAYRALADADIELARSLAEAAFRTATTDGNSYEAARAMTLLGTLAFSLGNYSHAAALAGKAERIAGGVRWVSTEPAGVASMLRSYGSMLAGRPGESLRLIGPAEQFAEKVEHGSGGGRGLQVTVIRAVAEFDLGNRIVGLRMLDAARRSLHQASAFKQQPASIALFEHQAARLLSRSDLVRTVLAWAEQRIPDTGELLLLRAHGPAAISRFGAARELLEPLLSGAVRPQVPWCLADAWVLSCHICIQTGAAQPARQAARQALIAADRTGAIRGLAYAPSAVIELITRYFGATDDLSEVVRKALAARADLALDELPPPLTDREQTVLALLPTMRSVEEIADDLTVSVNTVKSHVQALYGKLDVKSRRAAVERARRAGLIRTPGDEPG